MSYTHKQYIEDVRRLAADRLDGKDKLLIENIPIYYKCFDENFYDRMSIVSAHLAGHGLLIFGNTDFNTVTLSANFVEVFAESELCERLQLAFTIVHELGHVLAGATGHDQHWVDACKRLGLNVVPYTGANAPEAIDATLPSIWVDPLMVASIKALPAFTDFPDIEKDMKARVEKLAGL